MQEQQEQQQEQQQQPQNDQEEGPRPPTPPPQQQQQQHSLKRPRRRYYEPRKGDPGAPAELICAWQDFDEANLERYRLRSTVHTIQSTIATKEEAIRKLQQEVQEQHQIELDGALQQVATYESGPLQRAKDQLAQAELQHTDNERNRGYQRLVQWKTEYGHVKLPAVCPNTKTTNHPNHPNQCHDEELRFLCAWLDRQRHRRRKHLADVDNGVEHPREGHRSYQMELLTKLGVQWDIQKDMWPQRYQELVLFVQQNGHCNGTYLCISLCMCVCIYVFMY
jgi:hypothetical protein